MGFFFEYLIKKIFKVISTPNMESNSQSQDQDQELHAPLIGLVRHPKKVFLFLSQWQTK